MELRQRLDRLTATFTEELLQLIASASLDELHGRPRRGANQQSFAARPLAPDRASRGPARDATRAASAIRPQAKKSLKSSETARRAATNRAVATAPIHVDVVQRGAPRSRQATPHADFVLDRSALERVLLRALQSGLPMAAEDLFDAAGIDSSQLELAGVALDRLLTAGQVGKAGFAGSSLFFPKQPARPSSRLRVNPPEPSAVSRVAPVAPTPTAPWRPVVIRRKKFPAAPEADVRPLPTEPEPRVDEVTTIDVAARAS